MLRNFLPVGQGAFYVETFNNKSGKINCVYDCGSSTGIGIVEDQIRNTFLEKEEIEYVFISHVDLDHVNGLKFLLDYCRVKNLIMPYTKKKDRYLLKLDLLCSGYNLFDDSFLNHFIDDPVIALRQMESSATVWFVREPRDETPYTETNSYNGRNTPKSIQSGKNILKVPHTSKILTGLNWEYVPFNFREDERAKQFRTELDSMMRQRLASRDLTEIWENADDREKIIAAYKKVKGSLNANSMVLFSGSSNYCLFQSPLRFREEIYCPYCPSRSWYWCDWKHAEKKSGCLYTGDYEAKGAQKWEALYDAYKAYWNYIGCVQLPHHGSYKNYNASFTDLDAYFVISAGSRNKYRHPSSLVFKDLFLKHKPLSIVTEDRNTELIFDIS